MSSVFIKGKTYFTRNGSEVLCTVITPYGCTFYISKGGHDLNNGWSGSGPDETYGTDLNGVYSLDEADCDEDPGLTTALHGLDVIVRRRNKDR